MVLRRTTVIGALITALALAGCGSEGDDSSSSSEAASTSAKSADKPAKVAWLTYLYADYQQVEAAGLKEGVAPAGGSVKVFNANFDPQKLQQQCADAVSTGRYNVIVVTPVTPPTGVPCVTAAKAANIPVITLEGVVGKDPDNVDPQVDGVVGSVATSAQQGADDMAKLVAQACAGKDPCNVITDTIPGDAFGEANLNAVKAVSGVKVIQKINTNYDAAQMQKTAPDVFAAHPDVDVLVTLTDNEALAAVKAAKQAGLAGKVKILGAGGSRLGAQAVKDGDMFGTLATWPLQSGKLAGEMATKAANGQKIVPAGINGQQIDTPEIITPDTVADFKPEWGASRG